MSLSCTLSLSWEELRWERLEGWGVCVYGGVNSSTSKDLWRYSGTHHSTSSFLPLLLSLLEPFPAYQHFSTSVWLERERQRDRQRQTKRKDDRDRQTDTERHQQKETDPSQGSDHLCRRALTLKGLLHPKLRLAHSKSSLSNDWHSWVSTCLMQERWDWLTLKRGTGLKGKFKSKIPNNKANFFV